MKIKRKISLLLLLSLPFWLPGCSTVPDQQAGPAARYQAAMQDVRQGRFEQAMAKLRELREAGNARQREQAEVGLAYVQYKAGDLKGALRALAEFVTRHPDYPQLDYVIYLRGLIRLRQGDEHLAKLRQSLEPQQDYPQELREAYADFALLIRRFPQSRYVEPAYKHIETIRRQLAEYELQQARYFLVAGDYEEVVRRCRYIEEYYAIPAITRQALELQLKAYEALGKKTKVEQLKRRLQTLEES